MAAESATQTRTPPILPLAPEVVERIAAGEVIERPAAVVRELIENALDAGATSIRLELRDGGLSLIRVADDGWGIAPEQLALACQPHTTSKVRTLEDLECVATLGFRGEALASVAAAAEVELSSARDDAGLGARLLLLPGDASAAEPVARPRGTTVSVRHLFATLPARRAVLRGPRAEAALCLRVVRAYALLHAAIQVTLIADGLLLLRTPGTDRAAAAGALYGTDAARALLPLGPLELPEARLSGVVAPRAFHYATRDHVYLGVNGRPVANTLLRAAAEAGYRTLLRKGRHPLLVVALEVEPRALDAGVHPAKAEVLLRHEAALGAALRGAVHAALGAAPMSIERAPLTPPGGRFGRPLQLALPAPRPRHGARLRARSAAADGSGPSLAEDDASGPPGPLPPLAPLAQFDDALLLARSPEGHLYLVDQHRAHERVLYEQLRALRRGMPATPAPAAPIAPEGEPPLAGQMLLDPLLVELAPHQAALLAPRLDELRRLGLECQPFGGGFFLVRALPTLRGARQQPAAYAQALVEEAAADANDWRDAVCVALACRSAVRRGQALELAEQRALLDDLRDVATPALCPHGSPLLLRYTRGALARAFEW